MSTTTALALVAIPFVCYLLYGVARWAGRPADD